jgi:hypothetical protein
MSELTSCLGRIGILWRGHAEERDSHALWSFLGRFDGIFDSMRRATKVNSSETNGYTGVLPVPEYARAASERAPIG